MSARIRGALRAGLCFALVALSMLAVTNPGGSAPLVWVPGGVAVAVLLVTPVRRWADMLAALFLGQLGTALLVGVPLLPALGFATGQMVEALICACVGVRLMTSGMDKPQSYASIATLFAAGAVGACASTLIMLPFFGVLSIHDFAYWVLAHMIGTLAGTPLMMYLHDLLSPGEGGRRLRGMVSRKRLPLAILGLFALAVAVLELLPAPLILLLVLAQVFVVIRYGPLAASAAVLAYAAAAVVTQGTGSSPPAFADMAPGAATLILQISLLLMLATALPLSTLLRTYDVLQGRLRQQNAELCESLKTLQMAEKLAGIGRWRLELGSGRQHWSPAMLEMNGLDADIGPDPGDVIRLLPDGGEALFTALADHRDAHEPYTIDYTISPGGTQEQFLRMVVSNEFDEQGRRVAVFGVAMDMTMQVHRERALQEARQHALELAAEAQRQALTDPLTGLANRRSIFEQLGRLAHSSPLEGAPLTVVLFDIDHFKRVNDTFGHQTGDAVLQRIADLARAEVRDADLVGRIGGEEFVWLLPGVEATRARELAERLREVIERESARGNLPGVTVSLGMALLRRGDTAEQLIARADQALYRAKESGRNCVRRAA